FADVVAVISGFSLPAGGGARLELGPGGGSNLGSSKLLGRAGLKGAVFFRFAEHMGRALAVVWCEALPRCVALPPGNPRTPTLLSPEFAEPHRRGELLVAAVLNAALDIWLARLAKIGPVAPGKKDRSIVRDEGARVAGHLLTMAIRALDYCPPTDLTF